MTYIIGNWLKLYLSLLYSNQLKLKHMKTAKEEKQLKRLLTLRVMYDGDHIKCKSLDEQIKKFKNK